MDNDVLLMDSSLYVYIDICKNGDVKLENADYDFWDDISDDSSFFESTDDDDDEDEDDDKKSK